MPIWLRKFTYQKILDFYKPKEDNNTLTSETDPSKLTPLPKVDNPREKTTYYKTPKK